VVSGAGRDLGASSSIEDVQETATAALCAEMVGGMQWALDTTVQYVKDREAFGRPIGVFQAVQHKCADMLVQTESSRSAAYYAAYALANDLPDALFAVSVAKAYCSDAAHAVTGECIQLHGGIGFTWEHDAHLYFKRAATNRVILGDAAYHRERALELDPQTV
jgi:alkylation response protein AidB-like acyl-CoA dehydrogenase